MKPARSPDVGVGLDGMGDGSSPMVGPHIPFDFTAPEARIDPGVGWRGVCLILAFWTAFGTVTAASLLLSPLRQQTTAPMELVGYTFLGAYTWAALTLPLFSLTRRFRLERGDRVREMIALGGFGVLVALLVTTSVSFLSSLFVEQTRDGFYTGLGGMWQLARSRFPTDLLTSFVILSAGIARHYFLRHQARQEESTLLRAQLVESRLAVLRTQLNPHFLFNTLNALSALVATDPRGVRRMIARLSEILRYNLDGATEPEVSLEKEFQIVRRYLEIVEIRYQGRLRTRVAIEPGLQDALVPNLILQPLVENAMKHGVGRAAGHGSIEITARRDGHELVLAVEDSGAGTAAGRPALTTGQGSAPGGLGLRHTRERLEQLYGKSGQLHLLQSDGGGTVAEIRLPYHTLPAFTPSRPIAAATG